MKTTLVSIRPTDLATAAGRPALTPELLAASGARYSRNNEGLDAILDRIDPEHLDRSVDNIFRLIDYGHQSIADMVPVAIFIDDISIWLAYHVWSLCPTAGGQESSTRYIKMDPEAVIPPEQLGIPAPRIPEWRAQMEETFTAYAQALKHWEAIASQCPQLTSIPVELLNDSSDKAQKTVDRMKRNYRFDRARYYLPAAASTNMMLVMSARGWTHRCQHLCSHMLPEAQQLGAKLRDELGLSAPRLLKHACSQPGIAEGIRQEFEVLRAKAAAGLSQALQEDTGDFECPTEVTLDVYSPAEIEAGQFAKDLLHHNNRYGWVGSQLQRTMVRCGWSAIAMAEIRDLNRHRTGNKYCPLIPVGFYAALKQLPAPGPSCNRHIEAIRKLPETGRKLSAQAHKLLAAGDPTAIYNTLLGTQFAFERVTTADKFIYEAELRTGIGAHFCYAKHYKDALALWYRRYPETRGLILEGNAEPE